MLCALDNMSKILRKHIICFIILSYDFQTAVQVKKKKIK